MPLIIKKTQNFSLEKKIYKCYFWKIQFLFINLFNRLNIFFLDQILILHLTIKQNNIFLSCYNTENVIQTKSAGNFKIIISKKKLKYNSIFFLKTFFNFIKTKQEQHKYIPYSNIILFFSTPKFLRRHIITKFLIQFQDKSLLLDMLPKKSFNGCRVKKIRRKKYKKYRILQ